MKVECVHCGASGQMDETRIPPGVTTIRCPRCKQSFPIPTIGGTDSRATGEAAPNAAQASPPPPLQPPPLPQSVAPTPSPTTLPSAPVSPPPQSATALTDNCTVCSGQFPRDEMVRFGTAWVCAACKPTYVQMLAQGTQRPGVLRYAGFWIRFCAKMLDGLILGVVGFVITFALGIVINKTSPQVAVASFVISYILNIGFAVGYSGYFLGKHKATPGKMACGLEVLTPEGQRISVMRGVGRYFAEIISSMVLMIGYLMIVFDDEKRSLHDRVCNTRVVYK